MTRHALVVGGTKGMGPASVGALVDSGYVVSVIARTVPPRSAHVAGAHYLAADVLRRKKLTNVVAAMVAARGALAALVLFQRYRGTGDAYDGEIATSVTGTKDVVELAAPLFAESGGSIVIVSSVASRLVTRGQPVGYHVAKAALVQMARFYAVALGGQGVRVNSVSPGVVVREGKFPDKDLVARSKRMLPLARMGTAADVAGVVAFLCSPGASYLTGQDLVVDGGLSLLWAEDFFREIRR